MRRRSLLPALLIAPMLVLVTLSFLLPLGATLFRAVEDVEFSATLPRTAGVLREWSGEGLPPEEAFAAIRDELGAALDEQRLGALANRLNFEETGLRSLLLQTARAAPRLVAPYRDGLIALNPRWGDPVLWRMMQRASGPVTALFFLRALDHRRDGAGSVVPVSGEDAIFLPLFGRTLAISLAVTAICLLLAYPAAYGLTLLPPAWAHAGLLMVLVPFWTSILVRTTAWFILLQKEGPVNAALRAIGLIDSPLTLIFTRFAVYLAMVHVLLPFAILPLYGVMKGIRPEYMRAAASLGAPGWRAFLRVYLPLTLPGVASAALIVFMLAVGFYITPALVGGPGDQMVSAFIAFFTNTSVNWGMAAALASLLMAMTGGVILAVRLLVPGLRLGGVRP